MRKNYFIKKRFQANFFLKFAALLLLESLLVAGLFFYVSTDTITAGYLNSTLRIEKTADFFYVSVFFIMLIAAVAVAIVGMAVFMLFSHRIAGPLFRFEKALKWIEGGDLTTRIDLRRADQLGELKYAINTMAASLDERMGRIKRILSETETLIAKTGDPQSLSRIKENISFLKDEIGRFTVS